MDSVVDLASVWSQKLTGSSLYNIERRLGDGPTTGGGQLYIQIPRLSVGDLLEFLGTAAPRNGSPIRLPVKAIGASGQSADIEIHSKSAGRLRIANQNRFRALRHPAWSPEIGFPRLDEPNVTTEAANDLIESMGGVHIFLAFDEAGVLWGGFTVGTIIHPDPDLARILSGRHPGGVWRFSGDKE